MSNNPSRQEAPPRPNPIHVQHGAPAYRRLTGVMGPSNEPVFFSETGFDIVSIFSRLASRPNPKVFIGPVDFSCSFLVADRAHSDMAIIYVSPAFCKLTGYKRSECMGRNCRFLQRGPDGSDNASAIVANSMALTELRQALVAGEEVQTSLINYRKNGELFINFITIVPIRDEGGVIEFWVGFQVDANHSPSPNSEPPTHQPAPRHNAPPELSPASGSTSKLVNSTNDAERDRELLHELILDHSDDFLLALSTDGIIQFVSSSEARSLGHAPSELVGKHISQLAHPSDIETLKLELESFAVLTPPSRSASSKVIAAHYAHQNRLVHLLFRARWKLSSAGSTEDEPTYAWVESTGRVHALSSGNLLLLATRLLRLPRVSWSQIEFAGGLGDPDCWCLVNVDGIILSTVSSVLDILGKPPSELVGMRLRDCVESHFQIPLDDLLDRLKDSHHSLHGSALNPRQLTCIRSFGDSRRVIVITLYPQQLPFTPLPTSVPVYMSGRATPITAPFANGLANPNCIVCQIRFPLLPTLSTNEEREGTANQDYVRRAFFTGSMTDAYPLSMASNSRSVTSITTLFDGDLFEELRASEKGDRWENEIDRLRLANEEMKKEIEELTGGGTEEDRGSIGYSKKENRLS